MENKGDKDLFVKLAIFAGCFIVLIYTLIYVVLMYINY